MNTHSKPIINELLPQINQTNLSFPFRYVNNAAKPSNKEGIQSSFCLSPFLNRYAMPDGCVRSGQEAKKIISSLLGDKLLSLLPPIPSFSDCIRLLSYGTGFFSAGDLTYYLGIDRTFMRSFLAATEKSYHNFVRYKSKKNYNTYHYYLYKPNTFPYIHWSRLYNSPICYAGKTISPRSIPHIYSTSLSTLMMGLWSLRNSGYYFEFHPEVSLGNYENAAKKSAAKITIDSLCILKDQENNNAYALICLEQDMGTENYSTLLTKLYDYSHTYYFDDKAADGIYILFSCNRLIAAKPCKPLYEKKWFVALYMLFYQFLSLQRNDNGVINANMMSVISSMKNYLKNLSRRGREVVLNTIHTSCIFDRSIDNSLFGVPLSEIDQCILSLSDKIPDLIGQFFTAIGLDFPAGGNDINTDMHSFFNKQLPLKVFHNFLNAFPQDADFLSRLSYNKSLYNIALIRQRGFAQAILSVMLLRRTINTHTSIESRDHGVVFLYPIYQGYSIYTVSTPLISNYMPYMLWDRKSKEVVYLEHCISSYLPSDISAYTYSTLSPSFDIGRGGLSFSDIKDGAYFPSVRFRHYYYAGLPDAHGNLSTQQFCIEDLDADVGAYCRAYLFIRYYCSSDILNMIMLVDSAKSALSFYQDIVWGKKIKEFSQSSRCKVSLYAQDNFLSWDVPQLLFLERGNNLYADKRLFGVSSDGSIVYFR